MAARNPGPAIRAGRAPAVERVERLILWDIDGTLVHTAGVGAAAFATAIETIFGVPAPITAWRWRKTDPQIAREILTVARPARRRRYASGRPPAETERLVAAGRDRIRGGGRILPGVARLLEALTRPARCRPSSRQHRRQRRGQARRLRPPPLARPRRGRLRQRRGRPQGPRPRRPRAGGTPLRPRRPRRPLGRRRHPPRRRLRRAGGAHCLLVANGFAPGPTSKPPEPTTSSTT